MEKFLVDGGIPLRGEVSLSGAKNVALKVMAAAIMTRDEVIVRNIPDIMDVRVMLECLRSLGVESSFAGHVITLKGDGRNHNYVPLEFGARLRTSFLVLGPLLSTRNEAHVPNPGGCRIGARPIDRQITALEKMGARISYSSADGYFHGVTQKLHGAEIKFAKNTHTGTEAVILAAVLAEGKTVISNAAAEVEVDDLIGFLNSMGARIRRTAPREISVEGVASLHGTDYTIMSDRNEEVTLAISAAITGGEIAVRGSAIMHLDAFTGPFLEAGGSVEKKDGLVTYRGGSRFSPTSVVTGCHPGFMTDWQAPWAVLMTQADGVSTIHETIFESRFAYVPELVKMGAEITPFQPEVRNLREFYNFNIPPSGLEKPQAVRIRGPAKLHNAVLEMQDLRAGATLLLAALAASGRSVIYGVEHIDRGYEGIELRLGKLGARILRVKKEGI